MKLFKWNIKDITSRFPNIIQKFSGKPVAEKTSSSQEVSINSSDTDSALKISIPLPGLDKKEVKIEVQNDCLIVSSMKQYENEENNKNWILREYSYTSFKRKFQLPENADQNKIHAEMKNGVLHIKAPKKSSYIGNKKQILIE